MKISIIVSLFLMFAINLVAFDGSKNQNEFDKAYEYYNKGKFKEAHDIWSKLCDNKVAQSCTNLGFIFDNDDLGYKKDEKKAMSLYKKACELGDGYSCTSAGFQYENAQGVTQSLNKAYEYYEKDCKLLNAMGCTNVGGMYANGFSVLQKQ